MVGCDSETRDPPPPLPSGRRGGRKQRLKRRSQPARGTAAPLAARKIPVYELLGEESLQRLEDHADWRNGIAGEALAEVWRRARVWRCLLALG